MEIVSSRMGQLWDALYRAYDVLGLAEVAGGDEVFRQLVLARIIEPTSKQDSLRVLEEVGVGWASISKGSSPGQAPRRSATRKERPTTDRTWPHPPVGRGRRPR